MHRIWPLVGRDEELVFVERALEGSPGVVLHGNAGCGKSRLAAEVLATARRRRLPTIAMTATSATSIVPFGVFAHLLDDPIATDPHVVATDLNDAFEHAAAGRRLVVFVDDAHLIDEASADVIAELATTPAVFVLLAVRTGESVLDPIAALWKDGIAPRLDVQDLGWADVHELLFRVLHAPVDGETLARLWDATIGNPLYLRELVLGGLASGAFTRKFSAWRWSGRLLASRLFDLVDVRVAQASNDARDLLETIAVAGALDEITCRRLGSPGSLDELDRLALIGSLEDDAITVVRVAHPLYEAALRRRLSAFRERNIKRSLIDSFSTRDDRAARSRVAAWRSELGERPHVDEHIETTPASRTVVADRLARASIESGGGFDALRAHGEALREKGRYDEAETVFAELDQRARTAEQRALVAIGWASNLCWGLGRASDANDVLRRAESNNVERQTADELGALGALIAVVSGNVPDGIERARRVLDEPGLSERGLVFALAAEGPADAFVGRTRAAIDAAEHGMPAALGWAKTNPRVIGWLIGSHFLGAWFGGYLDEAESAADAVSELGRDRELPRVQTAGALARGRAELARGRVRTAADRLEEAAVSLRERDNGRFLPFCLGGLAQARALLGETAGALAAIEEARAVKFGELQMFDPDLELARAWATAADGRPRESIALALAAATSARANGQVSFEAIALHDALRLGADLGVAEQLRDLGARVEGPLPAARVAHAGALLQRDGAELDAAAVDFERAGALLLAAESCAQAVRIHAEHGRRGAAHASRRRASALLALCQGARTPAVWDAVAPVPTGGGADEPAPRPTVGPRQTAGQTLHRV